MAPGSQEDLPEADEDEEESSEEGAKPETSPGGDDDADVPPLPAGGPNGDVPGHEMPHMPGGGLPWAHPLDPTREPGKELKLPPPDPDRRSGGSSK